MPLGLLLQSNYFTECPQKFISNVISSSKCQLGYCYSTSVISCSNLELFVVQIFYRVQEANMY